VNVPIEEKPEIPPYIQNGKPLFRGTPAWIEREWARKKAGCKVICLYELAPTWSAIKPPKSRKKL
jgi:hypothetical protein